ncbi:hypothetical protein [Ruegeria conchae]|uniref:hypothetical protein n=1 Tax=Ruegeria conchae TaxID=981384 RepID=UPI000237A64E|nr:hypothetical protein [Ruegeria conchae]
MKRTSLDALGSALWKAREYGVDTRFIELAGEVNTAMPVNVFGKLASVLNERSQAVCA